ncbi:hypothetical protein [Halalkalicoccus jeotgali]|uniref:Uncharacterized protein n=1 Tax=Halalkalicoccus jeotgali (strain DSM 18796 / CECT 7217 / JCM 14584 / KCTC 4019 / B3) TaxID=795797 RepID=D8J5N7_HALJB|nr:hypothetical protein [Halalkalicoccus jeotgali]ADJ15733.1 hypothetical protein HacjB3_11750 [Halalkalicoccus jeotgali B3]ELY37243.1 hypothetical protein C497_10878 [Halalkalicoccus jeotgali B3]
MSNEEITLPWIDEPMDVEEALEALGQASVDDGEHIEALEDRIEVLEGRLAALEDGSSIECPECESAAAVYKSGVGAAKLANDGALTDASADALNAESHVCLDCHESFTPAGE